MHRRSTQLNVLDGRGRGGAFSGLKGLSLLMVSGIFLPEPALHMCLGAGGCKLRFRRHNQPQQDPKFPAARLPVRPLAETVGSFYNSHYPNACDPH